MLSAGGGDARSRGAAGGLSLRERRCEGASGEQEETFEGVSEHHVAGVGTVIVCWDACDTCETISLKVTVSLQVSPS